MIYMGSKTRIAKHILPIMLAERGPDQWWVEPFVGGANMIDKIDGNRLGADSNSYVIDALIDIRDSVSDLPKDNKEFTEDDYKQLRKSDECKYKGYAGFAFSYGGKWLGGWSRHRTKRDYVKAAYKSAVKQSQLLQGVRFINESYLDLQVPENSLIYCDPPYANTTKYKDDFDHDKFWKWCRDKVKEGHTVFVSEYNAPDDFKCVWSKEIINKLTKNTGSKKGVEKLFIHKGEGMNIIERIDEYHEQKAQEPRPHLGASQIGKECSRAIWYDFRLASKDDFSGRMLRLFRHGYTYEPIFIEDLRKVGLTVITKNRKTGKDISFKDINGHFCGSVDGMAREENSIEWFLLEFKTHSEKSFKKLVKQGVEKSKPQHYSQMQVYMHYMGVKKALYLSVNKNTDELYEEWVDYSERHFNKMRERAELIINSENPPPRLSVDSNSFGCRFCNHNNICHGKDLPEFNCRTCEHSSPADNGRGDWACSHHEKVLVFKDQLKACSDHQYIPAMVDQLEERVNSGGKKLKPEEDYLDFMLNMQKEFNAKVVKKEIKRG